MLRIFYNKMRKTMCLSHFISVAERLFTVFNKGGSINYWLISIEWSFLFRSFLFYYGIFFILT